jgi:hypothetical protein
MQLLTEVQQCMSLMDKKLSHFVEALLVSIEMLNQTLSCFWDLKGSGVHYVQF